MFNRFICTICKSLLLCLLLFRSHLSFLFLTNGGGRMYLTVSPGENDWVPNKISFQHSFLLLFCICVWQYLYLHLRFCLHLCVTVFVLVNTVGTRKNDWFPNKISFQPFLFSPVELWYCFCFIKNFINQRFEAQLCEKMSKKRGSLIKEMETQITGNDVYLAVDFREGELISTKSSTCERNVVEK